MTDIVPPLSDRPAHYRLSPETWEVILKAYVEGATVPELTRKWRVSEHALRKQITERGMTKRDWGDAQAITQAAMREEALAEARANDPDARAARLFDGIDLDEDDGDPVVLARAAILASGRAMRGRLWSEAKALAGLAESYSRLGERVTGHWGNGGQSPQDEAALAVILERLEASDHDLERLRRMDEAEMWLPPETASRTDEEQAWSHGQYAAGEPACADGGGESYSGPERWSGPG